jgi:putative component of toxin-antitoxin plasmid stabilization module
MSTPPRVRRVRFYANSNGRKVAREEFYGLATDGQAALADLFRRFENGQSRRDEVRPVRDGLLEFRVMVGNNPFRAYFFADGPRYVIVTLCTYKNQQKALARQVDLALDRMKAWKRRD